MTTVRSELVRATLIAVMAVACGKRVADSEVRSQDAARDTPSPAKAPSEVDETGWKSDGLPTKPRVLRETRLRLVTPAGFHIVLHPDAIVEVTSVTTGMATVRLSAYAISEEVPAWNPEDGWTSYFGRSNPEPILGAVPVESIEKLEPSGSREPPQPENAPRCSRIELGKAAGALAASHRRLVIAEPSDLSVAVLTNGGSVEVLEERVYEGHGFQRVRQLTDNVELQGWIFDPIRFSWGTHACEPRKVYLHPPGFDRLANGEYTKRSARFEVFGEKLADAHLLDEAVPEDLGRGGDEEAQLFQFAAPDLPASYAKVSADSVRKVVKEFRESPLMFGVVLVDEVAVCSPHYVTKTGVRIEASAMTQVGRVDEVIEYDTSLSELGRLSMDGPRIARAVNGESEGRVTVRCTSTLRLLGRDSESFHLMAGGYPVFGYHPDDATRWYTSLSSCEADLATHPRMPLEESRRTELAEGPARLFGGC